MGKAAPKDLEEPAVLIGEVKSDIMSLEAELSLVFLWSEECEGQGVRSDSGVSGGDTAERGALCPVGSRKLWGIWSRPCSSEQKKDTANPFHI